MSESCIQNAQTLRRPRTEVFMEDGARKIRCRFGNHLRKSNPSDKLTTQEVTQAVSAVLFNFPAKDIANATGGSIRAGQNIREGMNAMSLTAFLNACRSIPELRALAMDMMGCEAESDPEFVRGLALLMNSYARRQASAPAMGDLLETQE